MLLSGGSLSTGEEIINFDSLLSQEILTNQGVSLSKATKYGLWYSSSNNEKLSNLSKTSIVINNISQGIVNIYSWKKLLGVENDILSYRKLTTIEGFCFHNVIEYD